MTSFNVVPLSWNLLKSFNVPFNGNELIGIIARDFRELWAKQPFYMSAASSNFPGLIGSMDMINDFNVLDATKRDKNKVIKHVGPRNSAWRCQRRWKRNER